MLKTSWTLGKALFFSHSCLSHEAKNWRPTVWSRRWKRWKLIDQGWSSSVRKDQIGIEAEASIGTCYTSASVSLPCIFGKQVQQPLDIGQTKDLTQTRLREKQNHQCNDISTSFSYEDMYIKSLKYEIK